MRVGTRKAFMRMFWFGMILAVPLRFAKARLADMAFFSIFGVSIWIGVSIKILSIIS